VEPLSAVSGAGRRLAVGLVSGGLDSCLAVDVIQKQGFDVIGVFVRTPFLQRRGQKVLANVRSMASRQRFELVIIEAGEEYLALVTSPRFGYGKRLNPCIDCHIFMLRKAAEVMRDAGAQFVFTGEVLNQRGMSQTYPSLTKVQKESGLGRWLVRPLSARLLPVTEPEEEGLLDRERLLAIRGKQRQVQIAEAAARNLTFFGSPAGGCLLTDAGFSRRLGDLLEQGEPLDLRTCVLLQTGRHFRVDSRTRLIVARTPEEESILRENAGPSDLLLCEDSRDVPLALIRGACSRVCLEVAAAYGRHANAVITVRSADGACVSRHCVPRREKAAFSRYLIT